MKASKKELKMGGQAVIEGVMMRGADKWAVAVRTPEGAIRIRKEPWRSIGRKFPFLELPILRGAVILIESLVLGVKALSFSAEIASEEETATGDNQAQEGASGQEQKGFWWSLSIAATVVFSLFLGILIFFYLPLVLTEMLGIESPFWFNAVDGVLRVVILLVYLAVISSWREIRRVFEYHGAEHKTIFAYESGRELSWENIKCYSTFHPRCGTSFLLILVVVSILVFMFLGKPTGWEERLIRMLFIPLIGGVSYELIKLSGRYSGHPVATALVAPGLWLQRITTRQPDEGQVEVAVAALEAALELETISQSQESPLSVTTPARG